MFPCYREFATEQGPLWLFAGLKTAADVAMHVVEQRIAWRASRMDPIVALRTDRQFNPASFSRAGSMAVVCSSFRATEHCAHRILRLHPADCNADEVEMLRAHDLSGSVARHLSGCHSARKGVRNDADTSVTGDTEDEIRGSV